MSDIKKIIEESMVPQHKPFTGVKLDGQAELETIDSIHPNDVPLEDTARGGGGNEVGTMRSGGSGQSNQEVINDGVYSGDSVFRVRERIPGTVYRIKFQAHWVEAAGEVVGYPAS